MRKMSFLNIILDNNIKLYVKGDQAYYMLNLQPRIAIFPGLYLIMLFALCRYMYYMTYITCIMNK